MDVPAENQHAPANDAFGEVPRPDLQSTSRRSSIQFPVSSPGLPEDIDIGDEIRQYQSDTIGDSRVARRSREPLELPPSSTMTENSTSMRLQIQIHESVTSNRDGRTQGFIPYATLRGIMSIEAVKLELKGHEHFLSHQLKKFLRGKNYLRDEAQRIRGPGDPPSRQTNAPSRESSAPDVGSTNPKSYLKILAILITLERSSDIKYFSKEICDNELPLVKTGNWDVYHELRRRHSPEKPLECFRRWKQSQIAKFEEKQWTFIPATFEKVQDDVPHYRFEPARILPFITLSAHPEIVGGSAVVTKVTIHKQCHSFECENNQVFAIKRLNSENEDAFNHERETLKRYSNKYRHPHLIYLLASCEQDGVFRFLFPAAEIDLRKYWETKRPGLDDDHKKSLEWLAEQCEGLADGLHLIHRHSTWETSSRSLPRAESIPSETEIPSSSSRPSQADLHSRPQIITLFGRHGDIKPGNILWFPDSKQSQDTPNGVLKIADFGLTKFSTREVGIQKSSKHVPGTKSYMAPECRAGQTSGMLGPLTDIWSLGCVYLEFLAWWFGGWTYVQDFLRRRMNDQNRSTPELRDDIFFIVKSPEASKVGSQRPQTHVKASVTEFISELKVKSQCEFVFEFLSMIETKMLLVHIEEDDSSPLDRSDTGKRLNAKFISQNLRRHRHKIAEPRAAST